MPSQFLNFTPAVPDPDYIAESQTPAAGGEQALTLANTALDMRRRISITSDGNDSGRTFTVVGTDTTYPPGAQAVTEEITGPNTTTVLSTKNFTDITSVTVDDDTAGAITVGTSRAFDTPVIIIDPEATSHTHSIFHTVSITHSFKFTTDNLYNPDLNEYNVTWEESGGDKTASYTGTITKPVLAARASFSLMNSLTAVDPRLNFHTGTY